MSTLAAELLRRARTALGLDMALRARSVAALASGDDTDAKVCALIDKHGLQLAALAALLAAGSMTKQQFIDHATELLTKLATQTGRMGANQQGSPDAFSEDDAGTLMDSRADYLDGYADDLDSGTISRAQGAARAAMWTGIGWTALQIGRRAGAEDNGKAQVTWVCEDDNASCDDCIMLGDNSPYDIGDLPTYPGQDVQCGGNCRCHLEFESKE